MKTIHFSVLIILSFLLSSCWIEAVDNDDDQENGEKAIFEEETQSRLPQEDLSANTPKVIATDSNNDEAPDLIIAQEESSNKLLINDGNGNFENESQERFPPAIDLVTKDVIAAYLNNDDDLDLLFVNENNSQSEFYINNQNGTFSDASGRIPVQGDFNSIANADVDNDGDEDILIGNLGQNILLINSGNGNFSNRSADQLPAQNDNTRDVHFVDIDDDGDLDIILANDEDNRILINDGNGFFEDETDQRLPLTNSEEQTHTIQVADVNDDGAPDLFFGNVATSSSQADPQDRLLINDGDGEFSDETDNLLPQYESNTLGAAFHDLNSDGYPDLLVGDIEGGFNIFINREDGSFSDDTKDWLPENFSPEILAIEVADFSGDDLDDIYLGIYQNEDQLLIRQRED